MFSEPLLQARPHAASRAQVGDENSPSNRALHSRHPGLGSQGHSSNPQFCAQSLFPEAQRD